MIKNKSSSRGFNSKRHGIRSLTRSHGRCKDFFQSGGTRGYFQGGPKVFKFDFSHSKLRKQPFLLKKFEIQGARLPDPFPTPMFTAAVCDDAIAFVVLTSVA